MNLKLHEVRYVLWYSDFHFSDYMFEVSFCFMFKMFPLIKPNFNRFQMNKAQIKKKIYTFCQQERLFLVIWITDYFYSYCFRSRVTKLSSRPSQRSGQQITSRTNLAEATRRWVALVLCVTGTCTVELFIQKQSVF